MMFMRKNQSEADPFDFAFFIKNALTQKTIDHYILADGSRISHADLVGNSLQTQVTLAASNGVAYGGVQDDSLAAVAGGDAVLSGDRVAANDAEFILGRFHARHCG